jgi:hypothetical protein
MKPAYFLRASPPFTLPTGDLIIADIVLLPPELKLREETIVPPKVVICLPERRKPIFDTDTFIKRT